MCRGLLKRGTVRSLSLAGGWLVTTVAVPVVVFGALTFRIFDVLLALGALLASFPVLALEWEGSLSRTLSVFLLRLAPCLSTCLGRATCCFVSGACLLTVTSWTPQLGGSQFSLWGISTAGGWVMLLAAGTNLLAHQRARHPLKRFLSTLPNEAAGAAAFAAADTTGGGALRGVDVCRLSATYYYLLLTTRLTTYY